jgi:hypothetical protein
VYNLAKLLGDTHYPTFLVGFTSLLCMVLLKRHPRTRKLPGFLFVVSLFIIIMAIVGAIDGHPGAVTAVRGHRYLLLDDALHWEERAGSLGVVGGGVVDVQGRWRVNEGR